MPDRDIFDGCLTKPWNVAYRAIFSDANDPNSVPRSVEAMTQSIVGLEVGLEVLVELVVQECAPPTLFRQLKPVRRDVLGRFPIEIRDCLDSATSKTIRDLNPSAKQIAKDHVLACILTYATRHLAENSCAIVVAKADLGKDDDWVQRRLNRLQAELTGSREIRDLVRKVLRRQLVAVQVSAIPRRLKTDTAEVINISISR